MFRMFIFNANKNMQCSIKKLNKLFTSMDEKGKFSKSNKDNIEKLLDDIKKEILDSIKKS